MLKFYSAQIKCYGVGPYFYIRLKVAHNGYDEVDTLFNKVGIEMAEILRPKDIKT